MIRHTPSGRWSLGLSLAFLSALIWGTIPVLWKLLVQWVDVYTLAGTRFLVAGLLLLPILSHRHGLSVLRKAAGVPVLMCVATVGLCGNYFTYMSSLRFISPGAAQAVIQLTPVFVLFGGLLIFREGFSRVQWLGFAILMVGLGLFFRPRYDALMVDAGMYGWGIVLVVIAAVLWAVYFMSQKQLQLALPPEAVLFLIYAAGFVIFLPLSDPGELATLNAVQITLLLVSCVLTVVSYVSFGVALNHVEASRTGVLVALTPLIAMANTRVWSPYFPDLLNAEHLDRPAWFGAGMVVIGSILGALGAARPQSDVVPASGDG
jgi:drug/metabolite transporter (DMT)-like permease